MKALYKVLLVLFISFGTVFYIVPSSVSADSPTVTLTRVNLSCDAIKNPSDSSNLYSGITSIYTFNFSDISSGFITLYTTSLSSDSYFNYSDWNLSTNTYLGNLSISGGNITRLESGHFRIDFQSVKEITIIVNGSSTYASKPTLCQGIKSWSVSATTDDDLLSVLVDNSYIISEDVSSLVDLSSYTPSIVDNFKMPFSYSLDSSFSSVLSNGFLSSNEIYVDFTSLSSDVYAGTLIGANIYRITIPFGFQGYYIDQVNDFEVLGFYSFNPSTNELIEQDSFSYLLSSQVGFLRIYIWNTSLSRRGNKTTMPFFIKIRFNGDLASSSGLFSYNASEYGTVEIWKISNGRYLDLFTNFNILSALNSLSSGSPSSTSAVNSLDSSVSATSDVVSDYVNLESDFTSSFSDSQSEMHEVMSNTSLVAFANAFIWFTAQLNNLYNSLGDMRILVSLPFILGIALFLIGRGQVVFRDRQPEDERIVETVTRSYDPLDFDGSHEKLTGITHYVTETKTFKHRSNLWGKSRKR